MECIFRFRRFICFGMQYKKSKEERQRGKNSMNDAQLRRRELLRQTKQLYGERETVPPIHPRYGNLCKEQDEGGEEAGGSFYMRLVICILCFIFFVYMDQNHAEVANVNSTKIINEIERDVELEAVKEVWENFE